MFSEWLRCPPGQGNEDKVEVKVIDKVEGASALEVLDPPLKFQKRFVSV
jgi:hypothetical protein